MEFACILKLAFMAALVRLSSQQTFVPGLYFKNRFPCTLNPISLTPLALTIDFDFDFHSLRGSKSNNALETGHRLKNVRTVSDWLHHICFYLLFRLLSNYTWLACLADGLTVYD